MDMRVLLMQEREVDASAFSRFGKVADDVSGMSPSRLHTGCTGLASTPPANLVALSFLQCGEDLRYTRAVDTT